MTCDEQLTQWAAGVSLHNPERDECCPDFSCCQSELAAPAAERAAFVAADEAGRHSMLMEFLGRLIAARAPEKNVVIVG